MSRSIAFLNPAAQFESLSGEILQATQRTLARGHYILGPEVAAFEREIAEFTQTQFAIGVNSGSDALTLALCALEIGDGDEVITSPFTYIAPAESIYQRGARIVFADIHPRTFCLDPGKVSECITSRTRALLPVHLFGQPAPINELVRLANGCGAVVVEDVAQAIGATFDGKPLGAFGAIGCFSFYPTKNLGAAGDGGMCVTNNEQLARRLRMLRVHGIERRYYHELHGFNTRLDELQAAILRVKLTRLTQWNQRRQEIAGLYNSGLRNLPVELPEALEAGSHVYHVYALLTDRRDELQAHLAARGVPTLIYYPLPLHLQQVYAHLGYKSGDFPVAESVSRRILPLPMYPELSDDDVGYVTEQISAFFTG